MSKLIEGFAPVAADDCQILILGSMPSVRSLTHVEYYAHAQNAFWPIMATLFNFDVALPYAQRLEQLKQHKIALWDVVRQCVREGSLDVNIKQVTPNPVDEFLKSHKDVQRVCFNGQKAAQLFKRHFGDECLAEFGLDYRLLPSTSPAMASLTREQKLAAWRAALQGSA